MDGFLRASEHMIERWIEYNRGHEINPVRMRPHPIEFSMYFDA
jgi:glutamine synthetase